MAEIKPMKSESDSFPTLVVEKSGTCSSRQAAQALVAHTHPWLTTEWVNGNNVNFETHFEDYEIENPAVALQEALGDVVKWVVDGIMTEFGNSVTDSRGTRDCGCVH